MEDFAPEGSTSVKVYKTLYQMLQGAYQVVMHLFKGRYYEYNIHLVALHIKFYMEK